MPQRSNCIAAVLALVSLGICTAPADAQTKPPARTAQRGPVRQDSLQSADNTRPQVDAPRAPADPAGPVRGQAQPQQKPLVKVLGPQAPFTLTENQQKLLDQVLLKWEQRSDKVSRFKATFTRWEYDKAFGRAKDKLKSEGTGIIKYQSPDRGDYSLTDLKEYDPAKDAFVPSDKLDHWVCDGKSIYEFLPIKKQLIQRKLPPEMQGKAIADGPLPFLFGAKANQLKQRYWMKDVTPSDKIGKQIWLEAYPKRQQDASNFKHATLILSEPDFLPYALQIFLPDGENNTAYAFTDAKANDLFALVKGDFLPPYTPFGWKLIVEADPSETPKDPPPPTQQGQAKRPAAQRK